MNRTIPAFLAAAAVTLGVYLLGAYLLPDERPSWAIGIMLAAFAFVAGASVYGLLSSSARSPGLWPLFVTGIVGAAATVFMAWQPFTHTLDYRYWSLWVGVFAAVAVGSAALGMEAVARRGPRGVVAAAVAVVAVACLAVAIVGVVEGNRNGTMDDTLPTNIGLPEPGHRYLAPTSLNFYTGGLIPATMTIDVPDWPTALVADRNYPWLRPVE